MLVRRESKISMFKMVEEEEIIIKQITWLTLSLGEEARLVVDSNERIKLKMKMNKMI